MTRDETRPLSRVVDCMLTEGKNSAYLCVNRPEGGPTEVFEIPIHDLVCLADRAALAVRETLPATGEDKMALIAHSFNVAEARDMEALSIAFRFSQDSELRVALPKPLAYRLNATLSDILPFVGGSTVRN